MQSNLMLANGSTKSHVSIKRILVDSFFFGLKGSLWHSKWIQTIPFTFEFVWKVFCFWSTNFFSSDLCGHFNSVAEKLRFDSYFWTYLDSSLCAQHERILLDYDCLWSKSFIGFDKSTRKWREGSGNRRSGKSLKCTVNSTKHQT